MILNTKETRAKLKADLLNSNASSQGTSTLGLIYRVIGMLFLLGLVTFGVNTWL